MRINISAPGRRMRVLSTRFLNRFGLGDDTFLLILAVIIGAVSGAAAVGFHELINFIRDLLYKGVGPDYLYGQGIYLLIVFPTAGGLAVGLVSRYVFRTREGHGIVDVVESVMRSSGFQKPAVAIEKTLTSAFTIGSGGSAGAEGPIVQIGAAIASGVGQIFSVARAQMPVLTGCGCAAGISAIFNAPFGGVLFTLEVILQDFSIRSFTPVVLASVIAQVTTEAIFQSIHHAEQYRAIFAMPEMEVVRHTILDWSQVGNFVLLGIVCGIVGSTFTRVMYWSEHILSRAPMPRPLRPALGGALLGLTGVIYIYLFGHVLLATPTNKPFPSDIYPMPAFFGDGYGIIEHILKADFYNSVGPKVILLLLFLCFIKILGTGVTLGSGGSGGVIAPSLFIGATAGAILGYLLKSTGWFPTLQPELYSLVAMGAILAAVVHAPLASILIVFELTQDHKVMLPAMLTCIISVAVARLIYPDSVYTQGLRSRGVHVGASGDFVLLRRLTVEQIPLDPVSAVAETAPLQKLLDVSEQTGNYDFVVVDPTGKYLGMVLSRDLNAVLMGKTAVPLLVVGDVMRVDIPPVRTTDDLANVLDAFSRLDASHLPVCVPHSPEKVVGLISRAALIRKYQQTLQQA